MKSHFAEREMKEREGDREKRDLNLFWCQTEKYFWIVDCGQYTVMKSRRKPKGKAGRAELDGRQVCIEWHCFFQEITLMCASRHSSHCECVSVCLAIISGPHASFPRKCTAALCTHSVESIKNIASVSQRPFAQFGQSVKRWMYIKQWQHRYQHRRWYAVARWTNQN